MAPPADVPGLAEAVIGLPVIGLPVIGLPVIGLPVEVPSPARLP
jgi:hypothetical protein